MSGVRNPWIATIESCLLVDHGGVNAGYDRRPSAERVAIKAHMLGEFARLLGPRFRAPFTVRIEVDENFALLAPEPRIRKPAAVQIAEATLTAVNGRRVRNDHPALILGPPFTGVCRTFPGAHHDTLTMKLRFRGRRPLVLIEHGLHAEAAIQLSYTFPHPPSSPRRSRRS